MGKRALRRAHRIDIPYTAVILGSRESGVSKDGWFRARRASFEARKPAAQLRRRAHLGAYAASTFSTPRRI